MSFSVYAVRVINGKKHRHFISETSDFDEAKHVANCCTCGNATYAYVKQIGVGTVFFIRSVDYQETDCQANPSLQHLRAGSNFAATSDQMQQLNIS